MAMFVNVRKEGMVMLAQKVVSRLLRETNHIARNQRSLGNHVEYESISTRKRCIYNFMIFSFDQALDKENNASIIIK